LRAKLLFGFLFLRFFLRFFLCLVFGELQNDRFGGPLYCSANDLRATAFRGFPDVLTQYSPAFFLEVLVYFSQQIVGKPAAASELVSIPAYATTEMADHNAATGEPTAILDPDRGRSTV